MTVFHILCILINLLQCSCDVCANGPPELQNLRKETDLLMQVIAAHHASKYKTGLYDDDMGTDIRHKRYMGKLNLRMIVSKIREQVGSLSLSACVKFLQWHLDATQILTLCLVIFIQWPWTPCAVSRIYGNRTSLVARPCSNRGR